MARRINSNDFATVYIPMARDGKSAAEIAERLGIAGDDAANYVCIKACQLRRKIKERAVEKANELSLKGKKRDDFISEMEAKVPKLKKRAGKSQIDDTISFIDSLISDLDAKVDDEVDDEVDD